MKKCRTCMAWKHVLTNDFWIKVSSRLYYEFEFGRHFLQESLQKGNMSHRFSELFASFFRTKLVNNVVLITVHTGYFIEGISSEKLFFLCFPTHQKRIKKWAKWQMKVEWIWNVILFWVWSLKVTLILSQWTNIKTNFSLSEYINILRLITSNFYWIWYLAFISNSIFKRNFTLV